MLSGLACFALLRFSSNIFVMAAPLMSDDVSLAFTTGDISMIEWRGDVFGGDDAVDDEDEGGMGLVGRQSMDGWDWTGEVIVSPRSPSAT